MATKLTIPLKREVEIDGKTYTVCVDVAGVTLTQKRHRTNAASVSFRRLLVAGVVADQAGAK